MLRLAADENFNIVRGLLRRKPDLDIVRVQEVGLSGADDAAVLEWAAQEGRVLLTHDVMTMTGLAATNRDQGPPMVLRFEWGKRKAAANLSKHRVSFDEASTVFRDSLARIFDDEDHSEDETREIIIGHSALRRLLVVSFTEKATNVIRVISARLATNAERQDYEENFNP